MHIFEKNLLSKDFIKIHMVYKAQWRGKFSSNRELFVWTLEIEDVYHHNQGLIQIYISGTIITLCDENVHDWIRIGSSEIVDKQIRWAAFAILT